MRYPKYETVFGDLDSIEQEVENMLFGAKTTIFSTPDEAKPSDCSSKLQPSITGEK